MKIQESVETTNAQKTVLGDREVKLTLDTDTGRVAISNPAMFTDPIVSLDVLEEKIAKLRAHMDTANG